VLGELETRIFKINQHPIIYPNYTIFFSFLPTYFVCLAPLFVFANYCQKISIDQKNNKYYNDIMKKEEPTIQDILEAVNAGFSLMEERLDQKLEEKLEQKLEEKLEQKLEEKLEQKLEEKLEQKFDEKLAPIKDQLFSIRQDIARIDDRLQTLIKTTNEDGIAMNMEIEKLKKKVSLLEAEINILKNK
jgi:hypothetical protein